MKAHDGTWASSKGPGSVKSPAWISSSLLGRQGKVESTIASYGALRDWRRKGINGSGARDNGDIKGVKPEDGGMCCMQ